MWILMKSSVLFTCILMLTSIESSADPIHSGRAQVEWVAKTAGYNPGEPVVTALKMTLDDGWHTYWINPGEAGMPLSMNLTLPDGWSADPVEYPLPVRFMTGDLHDFGYEGTVLFPITLHPPADASGDVEIKGSFDWLTCDDSACVPGDATLTLALASGNDTPTDAAEEIAESLKKIPTAAPENWTMSVSESDDSLLLKIDIHPSLYPPELDFFPLTINVVHPGADYDWKPAKGPWVTRVPKSSFAPDQLEQFELVIHSPSLPSPVILTWKAD